MTSLNKIKSRYWAFILYLDSAPQNWKDILQQTGCQFAISPYHDSDINADGSTKKPHYHVIVCYDGPTTFNVISRICNSVNATIPQPLSQIRGYYRYLTHKDNPEKFQYSEKDITTINGFNIDNYIDMTYTEVAELLLQIQYLIRDKHILEYSDLLDYCIDNDLKEFWDVARNHTLLLQTYINSRRFKTQQERKQESEKNN